MSRWPNKYVIGLTGNIAVGKSVVRQMLQHLGAYTIDADGLVHQAMAPGAPAYKPIVDTFGQFILNAEKQIDRAILASVVFANPAALAKLEAITHPIVGQAINVLVSRAQQSVIVVEAIKLLEGDLAKLVDAVWVVDAKAETQIKRLMDKRKMPEAEARQRVAAQNPQVEKLAKANIIIHNDGNVEETWKQVQSAWTAIPKPAAPAAAAPAPKPAAAAPAQPA
ncbi:MAG: dephospho-CoA kinase, partial [Chloroflexi bacterium]|nr:dephospho-CoA kinase [Chloroflexota bacterium]